MWLPRDGERYMHRIGTNPVQMQRQIFKACH
jgi:hypothetical protein